jgi:hypothetical protein
MRHTGRRQIKEKEKRETIENKKRTKQNKKKTAWYRIGNTK